MVTGKTSALDASCYGGIIEAEYVTYGIIEQYKSQGLELGRQLYSDIMNILQLVDTSVVIFSRPLCYD